MRQNKRSIVRRRTQQLVYLELGRENGGVMLNLSEEGCGFQAITPVKCGETRFAFQINGGRRIAGDAEVMWADEGGVLGGLRFLNLPAEAHKEIRLWLAETNAPVESGFAPPVAYEEAPQHSRAYGSEQTSGRDSGARLAEAAAPPSPAWTNLQAYPPVEDDRSRADFPRDDLSFGDPNRKSAALWRGVAGVATLVALAVLVILYQREVGTSLIWLGETLAGKAKASTVVPDRHTSPESSATGGKVATLASDVADEHGSALPIPEDASVPPKKELATMGQLESRTSTPQAQNASSPVNPQTESLLERQGAAPKMEPAWNEGDSVESLWGAVQGGSISAEVSLAERFARGQGVNKNCDQAKVLMKAAAERGNRTARLRLYEMESGGCR